MADRASVARHAGGSNVATEAAVEAVYRDDAGRLTATLIRSCGGDFQLAEDSL